MENLTKISDVELLDHDRILSHIAKQSAKEAAANPTSKPVQDFHKQAQKAYQAVQQEIVSRNL